MQLTVQDIVGLAGLPKSNRGIQKWLSSQHIPVVPIGQRFTFNLADLPEDARRAFLEREAERNGLPAGDYDAEAHAELMAASRNLREEADRKARVVRFILARRAVGLTRSEAYAAAWAEFGTEGNSEASLDRWQKMVAGVAPVNFAPALLDGYRPGGRKAQISPEAWALFEGGLKAAFKTHRLTALYEDVARVAKRNGWAWPHYSTVLRRLQSLPMAEQLALRMGRSEANKALYQPQLRSSTDLRAMEWVALDGRTVDVWVTWPDGTVLRPTVLGLVDQASGKVLGFKIARSENAEATAELEREVFGRFGAPDNLLTDNGAAFSGHMHAGRVAHKHRNKGNRNLSAEPPGIHMLLGFSLHFALPRNAKAKLMERKFADMSREIDTSPEFMGAHAGSNPSEKPEGNPVPVPFEVFEAVYRARVALYNAREGRRSQGCQATRTRSYDAAFEALSAGRPKRVLTEYQLRLATMEWTLSTVTPEGRLRGKDGWIYGEDFEDGSQDTLMRRAGEKLWVGTDPLDRSKPALVWDPVTDRIILDGVHAVIRGKFDDAEGARRAARRLAHVRKSTKKLEDVDQEAARATILNSLAAMATEPAPATSAVVQPHFKTPIKAKRSGPEPDGAPTPAEMAQYRRNMDEKLRRSAGSDGKVA